MYQDFGLFLDGAWCPASDRGTADVFSPVTEKPLGGVPVAKKLVF